MARIAAHEDEARRRVRCARETAQVADGVAGAVEEEEAGVAEVVEGVEVADLEAGREGDLAQLAAGEVAV
jgi:hypothetical protein